MYEFERQEKIVEYLKTHRFATFGELSKIVWASESSVRRDIKALEHRGYVRQIYGGAVLTDSESSVVPVELRDSTNSSEKEELARRAAEYIFDGATIIMDGSSTVRRIARYMGEYKNLRVITNNQRLFNECNVSDISLYCTGGQFLQNSSIFVGPAAEAYINGINADIVFFSSQAISDAGEISDVSEEETSLRRVMLARAKKRIFLCDSSKIGQKRTFTLCTKDDVDAIICDKPLPWENI